MAQLRDEGVPRRLDLQVKHHFNLKEYPEPHVLEVTFLTLLVWHILII